MTADGGGADEGCGRVEPSALTRPCIGSLYVRGSASALALLRFLHHGRRSLDLNFTDDLPVFDRGVFSFL